MLQFLQQLCVKTWVMQRLIFVLREIHTKLAFFKKAQLVLSGRNLVTKTKYTGYDPEVSSYIGNDASMGIDFGNYPAARTYTFGLEVSF